jgi:hypothetical protein
VFINLTLFVFLLRLKPYVSLIQLLLHLLSVQLFVGCSALFVLLLSCLYIFVSLYSFCLPLPAQLLVSRLSPAVCSAFVFLHFIVFFSFSAIEQLLVSCCLLRCLYMFILFVFLIKLSYLSSVRHSLVLSCLYIIFSFVFLFLFSYLSAVRLSWSVQLFAYILLFSFSLPAQLLTSCSYLSLFARLFVHLLVFAFLFFAQLFASCPPLLVFSTYVTVYLFFICIPLPTQLFVYCMLDFSTVFIYSFY